MEALEQRVSRLYQYIGDPVSGDLFATVNQVQRLETLCHEQQQIIQNLQNQQDFFQRGVTEYFEQQFQTIINQKGIRNTDFIALTKFFTQSLVHAVTTVQTECSKLIQTSIPLTKLQELEQQIKRLRSSGGNSASAENIQNLEIRLRLLEIQSPSTGNSVQLTEKQSGNSVQLAEIQQTVQTLQDHVKHLEDNLITEVQKHYKMATKQGELAAPLVRIQNTVQMLDQEFQSFRGMDPRKVAEALIQASTENLRTEFQTALATRASKEDLERFDTTVRRVEAYSTDVQTGFYKMKQQLEETAKQLTDKFSDTRWNRLETNFQHALETKHKTQLSVWNSLLETQQQTIQQQMAEIQQSATRIFQSVQTHTSPEAFSAQFQRLKQAMIEDQQGCLEKLVDPIQSRMTAVEKQVHDTRTGFLQLSSELKTELSASGLQQIYAGCSDKLAEFQGTVTSWNQRLEKIETSHKQGLLYIEDRTALIEETIRDMEKQIQSSKQSIVDNQKEVKKELTSWLQDRKGEIQKRFTDAAQEIQHIQRSSVQLEGELYKQLESYRAVERSLAEKFREAQAKSEQTVVAWREEQSNYIVARMAELSSAVRNQIQEANERAQIIESMIQASDVAEINAMRLKVSDCLERVTELNQRFGQTALRALQKDVETNIRSTYNEWLRKRVEEEKDALRRQTERLASESSDKLETQIQTQVRNLYEQLRINVQSELSRQNEEIQILTQRIHTVSQQTTQSTPIQSQNRLWYQSQNKCFYTALFGTRAQVTDTLSMMRPIPGWDAICFTNQTIVDPNGWTIVRVEPTSKSMALEAKRYKWLSHTYLEDYDLVVWIDAYLSPQSFAGDKLYQWIMMMKERGLSILHRKHGVRDCVWEECTAVIEHRREIPERVQAVQALYKQYSMPKHIGLFDTNILIKFHKDPQLKEVAEQIVHYCEQVTTRDQLLVTFVYHTHFYKKYDTADLQRIIEPTGQHVRSPAF